MNIWITFTGGVVIEPGDDQVARAVPLHPARASSDGDEALRLYEGECPLDRGAVCCLDRRALLGRTGHPKH